MIRIQDFVRARLYENEEAVLRDALRCLLRERPDLRIGLAIYRYEAEGLSLSRAAVLAGVSWAQMKQLLVERGIQPHLGPETVEEIRQYKSHQGGEHAQRLWQAWCRRFDIAGADQPFEVSDGALDALVCATVAYLYHHAPQELLRLPYPAAHKRGRGPFYVTGPAG